MCYSVSTSTTSTTTATTTTTTTTTATSTTTTITTNTNTNTTTCAEFYCVNLPLACVVLCQFSSKKYVGVEKIISESELATLSFTIW